MPKILCISPYVPHPVTHGGSIRTRLLLDALRGLGELHLAAPVLREQDRADAQYLALTLDLTAHELEGRADGSAGKLGKLSRWFRGESEMLARRWTPAAVAKVSSLLATYRFDLVVADGAHALPLVPLRTRPLLFHMHNVESAILARPPAQPQSLQAEWTRRIEARQTARVEARYLKAAAINVAVSDSDRALALSICNDANIVTVPNAVEIHAQPIAARPAEGPLQLLFVGRLDYPPNLEAVTELVERHLPALRAAFPGVRVRVVGEDSKGKTQRLQRDGVEFLGRVSDLEPHYATSHAAYIPLRSGGGTRLKILEAFSLGLPVASTSIGAEGLAAKDRVHFRQFDTPEQGVVALRDLLGEQRRSYVERARALVQAHYSRDAAVSALRKSCEFALNSARSAAQ